MVKDGLLHVSGTCQAVSQGFWFSSRLLDQASWSVFRLWSQDSNYSQKKTSSDVQTLLTHPFALHLLMLHWREQVTWPCPDLGKREKEKELFLIGGAAKSYFKRACKQEWNSFIVAIFANNLWYFLMDKVQSYISVPVCFQWTLISCEFAVYWGVLLFFTYIFSIIMNSWVLYI